MRVSTPILVVVGIVVISASAVAQKSKRIHHPNQISNTTARRIISNTIRHQMGWKKVRVRLGTDRIEMFNHPHTGRWAQHSTSFRVEPLDKGPNAPNWTFSSVMGRIDLTKKGSGQFSYVHRKGSQRLYRFIQPTFLNGHSYQPMRGPKKK